jgi:SAM-dependent methyltransferase
MSQTESRSADARLDRERAFHDERFARNPSRSAILAGMTIGLTQDALDVIYAAARERCQGGRVLDYGCSQGQASFILRRSGARFVQGIDISAVAVQQAAERARAEGITDVKFDVMNAEALDLPDGSFDLVFGIGVLHHLDLDRAAGEIARVLTDRGSALFLEPLGHNPFINAVRRLTPSSRTADEHPLRALDFRAFTDHFQSVDTCFLNLTTLLTAPFSRAPGARRARRMLAACDRALFHGLPFLTRYAWNVVVKMQNPRRPG